MSLSFWIVLFLLIMVSLGLALIFSYPHWWFPKMGQLHLSDIIPFNIFLEDDKTIKCHNGMLVRVFQLAGADYTTKSKEEITRLISRRVEWFNAAAREQVDIRLYTIKDLKSYTLQGKFANNYLFRLHHQWMKQFESAYEVQHYLILSIAPKQLLFKTLAPNLGTLDKFTELTLDSFYAYGPILLSCRQHSHFLMRFLQKIIGTDIKEEPKASINFVHAAGLHAVHLEPLRGLVTCYLGEERVYKKALTIIRWGETAPSELLNALLRINGSLTIIHGMHGILPMDSSAKLRYAAKQAAMGLGGSKAYQEHMEVIKRIDEGEVTLFHYQCIIWIQDKNLENLNLIEQYTKRVVREYGATIITETAAIEWLWRYQFLATNDLLYPAKLLSATLADFITLQQEARGQLSCDWGEGPIRFFKTTSGSAYAFQFHIDTQPYALGHCLVVAPSGSGKTTLFQHLIAGALRHDIKAYVFDRLQGSKIFTNSLGGCHIDIGQEAIPLNPLASAVTANDENFLKNFFLMLSGLNDELSQLQAAKAVDIIMSCPSEKRILTDLFDIAFVPNSKLKKNLQSWVGHASLARWFNGAHQGKALDALDINHYLLTFEMAAIQKDPRLSACLTYYLMHRIRAMLQNKSQGHLIFIDEIRSMLTDPLFKQYTAELLLEHRKLRGSVNICFQDVGSILALDIANLLLEQCPTKLLFPNPYADREQYKVFELTDYEWDYIKERLPISKSLKYSVLVKKSHESVILNIDLTGLGHLLKLYRSGPNELNLARQLQAQYGDTKWVEFYLEK